MNGEDDKQVSNLSFCILLSCIPFLLKDWRALARQINLSEYIAILVSKPNPAQMLLLKWGEKHDGQLIAYSMPCKPLTAKMSTHSYEPRLT